MRTRIYPPQSRRDMKLPRTTPISATLFGCFSSNSPQNRHPERSASPIYRVTQRLWARKSKDLEDAHLTHAARTFSTTEARERDLRNVDVAYGRQHDAAVIILGPPGKTVAASPLDAGSVRQKAQSSRGKIKQPRGPSTARPQALRHAIHSLALFSRRCEVQRFLRAD